MSYPDVIRRLAENLVGSGVSKDGKTAPPELIEVRSVCRSGRTAPNGTALSVVAECCREVDLARAYEDSLDVWFVGHCRACGGVFFTVRPKSTVDAAR